MKKIKENLKIYFLLFLFCLNIFIYSQISYLTGRDMLVAFLDVGQGDSIFIKTPNGRQILIDGGANNNVLRQLGQVMPFYDRSLDVVLATHADQDHIGGLVEVLKRFKVDLFIRTNSTSISAVYKDLENIIKEKRIQEEIISAPALLSLDHRVNFNILFPNYDTAGWEANESSIVAKLIYGDNSFLLTGDAPQFIENYLIKKYSIFLDSDVLKAGHHGSKTSSSELFVNEVSPLYTIISAGLNNRYGHPHSDTLNILNKFEQKILQTMDMGMIKFKSDGKKLILIK